MCPKEIGSYRVEETLGIGGFGKVLLVTDKKTLLRCALKLSYDREMLRKEYKIMKQLSSIKGFCKVYGYGKYEKQEYIVQELHGKDLSYCNNDKILSVECVCAIGIQLLERMEKMHENDIIHRDIKPSQFLISNNQKSIVLIDFGMAKQYRFHGVHKDFKTKSKYQGSVSYASINTHMGFTQSRRDDLESLCYSIIYLIKGSLPWKLNSSIQGFKKWKVILNQKIKINEQELFGNLPSEFSSFLKYTRRLTFDQNPDYLYLKSLLSKFLYTDDLYVYFDWLDHPLKPTFRNPQIIEGATTVTKLKRDKDIKKSCKKAKEIMKRKRIGTRVSKSKVLIRKSTKKDLSVSIKCLISNSPNVFDDILDNNIAALDEIIVLNNTTKNNQESSKTHENIIKTIGSSIKANKIQFINFENPKHELNCILNEGEETPPCVLPEFRNRNILSNKRRSLTTPEGNACVIH
jgi:casein kinase I homolog HRR25